MATRGVAAARAELLAQADRPALTEDLGESLVSALRLALPVDGWCVIGFDPVSGLRSMMYSRNGVADASSLARNEFVDADLNRYVDLARRPIPVGIISQDDPDAPHSIRLREILRPAGFTSEMRVALQTGGVLWGALALFRSDNVAPFGHSDTRAAAELVSPIANAIRRYTVRHTDKPTDPLPTGVMIVDALDTVISSTTAADDCVGELMAGGDDEMSRDDILRIVFDATARARHTPAGQPAVAVIRGHSGRWLAINAAPLHPSDRTGDVAVTLGPAGPSQVLPAFARWHGLTSREHAVLRLLADGLSTRLIARHLDVSMFTAEDHLRAIYRKTVSSGRSQLIASLM
ncbi:MAG TPA: LuxR C-terminal-related transcriptional regulator [Jatrophihabitantaceae bacterium]|nr:LuxR C-terminal-related transcriptional regulator [Jatrophihabitantaceae bacterium]